MQNQLATSKDLEEAKFELSRDLKELELKIVLKLGKMMTASIAIIATLLKLL